MAFNEKQMKAINTIDGPVMVVSCPGSGKTTVVVNRARKIVDSGIPEERILVITFTKASAEEMKERYIKEFGETNIVFATIHSICLMMLKKAYGLTNDKIITFSEQYQIMTEWLKDEDIKDLDIAIPMVYTGISYCNNRNIGPSEYRFEEDLVTKETFIQIFNDYKEYKHNKGLLDFDDILLMTKELLEQRTDWLAYFQSMFQYLMIDEYQDTNKIQADIFYAIAKKHQNICVVGDDDQSIYAFRAADSSIMMNFEKEFPNCQKIFMDTNYRSCPEIISHASALIQNNEKRFKKDFKVGRKDEGKVTFIESNDSVEEIIESLEQIMKEKKNPEDYAILFRMHSQASLLINQLITKKIPFQAADKFKDIHDSIIYQDILSFWRLANNKALPYDFQKVINKPNKFFKRQDFSHIKGVVGVNRTEIFKVIDNIEEDWKRRQNREKMRDFLNNLLYMQNKVPKDFFEELEHGVGYIKYIKEYCDWTCKSEDEMLTLYNTLKKEALKHATMQEWFDSVQQQKMIMLEKRKGKDNKEGFILSTFHSSKGLEWKNVIILDANEGFCPISKAQTDDDIEEERRLFYVAMTRAKDNLKIYSIAHDSKHPISRFVNEAYVPAEVEFADGTTKEEREIEIKKRKADELLKEPERVKKEENNEVLGDFIIPFGMANHCEIKDVEERVLRWYVNNIHEESKYFFVAEKITEFLKNATTI